MNPEYRPSADEVSEMVAQFDAEINAAFMHGETDHLIIGMEY
jgi:hypothetical protein